MQIKLICFDLWNTLAKHNVNFKRTVVLHQLIQNNLSYQDFITVFEESLQTRRWRSRELAYTHFLKNLGAKYDKALLKKVIKICDLAENNSKLFSHTIPLLKRIKKNGFSTAILSNSSTFSLEKLTSTTQLLSYIDYPVFSFNAKSIKPNREIYQKLLEVTKFKPKEILMIGDNPKDDEIPVKKIGMHAIHYQSSKKLIADLKKKDVI